MFAGKTKSMTVRASNTPDGLRLGIVCGTGSQAEAAEWAGSVISRAGGDKTTQPPFAIEQIGDVCASFRPVGSYRGRGCSDWVRCWRMRCARRRAGEFDRATRLASGSTSGACQGATVARFYWNSHRALLRCAVSGRVPLDQRGAGLLVQQMCNKLSWRPHNSW